MIAREEESTIGAILALPIVDAPVCDLDGPGLGRMGPDLFSIRGVYTEVTELISVKVPDT